MIRKRFEPTKQQQAIMDLDGGSFLVIAPPGSGKTTVLTERVARLVANPSDTFRVLALTFTNKASANMRNRLFEAVGEHSERVTACTFHAFCLDVLRNYGDEVAVPSNVSIYENDGDQIAALHRGLVDDGLIADSDDAETVKLLRHLHAHIGKLKRKLINAVDIAKVVEERGVPVRAAYAAYDRTLRLYNALDFDDLIFFAFRLFTTAPRIASHYRRMYRYIVVDEAQDTSSAQYGVLRALCGDSHRNVMLVADADQSIFQFAGATMENLTTFEREFAATRVSLTQNFRCADSIARSANKLIEKNPKRITTGDIMTSALLASGSVGASSYADENTEARAVSAIVAQLLSNGLDLSWVYSDESTAVEPEDICILGRSRYALEGVLAELTAHKILYQFSTGRKGLFETVAFRAFDSVLRHAQNPKDVLARRALLNLIPEDPNRLTSDDGPPGGLLPMVVADAFEPARTILAPTLGLLQDVTALNAVITDVVAAARTVVVANEQQRAMVLADAATLATRWEHFFRRTPQAERTISGFLSDLALTTRSGVEGPGVRVLTIHAAKGLEFRAVILVGMNEDSFPDYRSTSSNDNLAEERRNAYVAITRAERMLRLTRPRSRMMPWGEAKRQHASRFLLEAGIVMHDE